jgi:hypothetical protein
MEQVPLEKLLIEYVDVVFDEPVGPYMTFLRHVVVQRLIHLAYRKGRKAFEDWKVLNGKRNKSDNDVVSEALDNFEPEFFVWLSDEGSAPRLSQWKRNTTGKHARLAGYFFVKYFVSRIV